MNRPLILILAAALLLIGLFFILRPSTPGAGPQARTIDLVVSGGEMTPPEITAREGDRLTFNLTSDRAVKFHLHGYDVKQEVEPGSPATLTFDATLTGRFEIEDEATEEELGTLIVEPR